MSSGRVADLPSGAYATALAALPGVGPRTLYRLLESTEPKDAWASVVEGRCAALPRAVDRARVRATTRTMDVAALWAQHRSAGVGAVWVGGVGYPEDLRGDPAGPGVLFHLGDPAALRASPAVAIVGTRSATRYGLGVAAQLGAELGATGVSVVSGLALGIDGAAHEGACAAWAAGEQEHHAGRPVGVVAGGLDRPYPARHAGLWRRVAEAGVIVSTSPIGTPLERGRFPQRNRLLAALCDVAVVVESHHFGGALSTALDALDRGKAVGAVPGSIRSPSSAGTNDLLYDGAFVVRDASDVRTALDLETAGGVRAGAGDPGAHDAAVTELGQVAAARAAAGSADARIASAGPRLRGWEGDPRSDAARVLGAFEGERCSVDQLAQETGLSLPRLSATLEALAAEGRLVGEGGWWEHV